MVARSPVRSRCNLSIRGARIESGPKSRNSRAQVRTQIAAGGHPIAGRPPIISPATASRRCCASSARSGGPARAHAQQEAGAHQQAYRAFDNGHGRLPDGNGIELTQWEALCLRALNTYRPLVCRSAISRVEATMRPDASHEPCRAHDCIVERDSSRTKCEERCPIVIMENTIGIGQAAKLLEDHG